MEEYILKLLKELKEEIRLADQRIKQLELKANKGVPNGYAELDANAKIPVARLPEISLSNINIDADKDWNAKKIVNVNQLGIGTTTPSAGLEINCNIGGPGGWYKGIHFTSTYHSAITLKNPDSNKGGLLFGLHGLQQRFYFAHYNPDDSFDKYIMTIEAINGRVGILTLSPAYPLDVAGDIRSTGNIRTSGKAYLGTEGFYAQSEYKTSATVSSAGWYRVAAMYGEAGRGQQQVTIYTIGGSYAPKSTTFRWFHDWNSEAGISVISEAGQNFWTDVRVTDDGTNSFLEVYFNQAISSFNIGLQYIGGHDRGTIFSGSLPPGGDTVRITTKANALFALNDKFLIDSNGRLGIGTTTPTYQLQLSSDSAAKPATNTWTVISDERIKKNIIPADLKRCYEIVKNLQLVHFSWDDGLYTDEQVKDKSQLGWLSQDVEKFFPKSVTTTNLDYAQKVQVDEEEYEEQAYEIKISKEKQIEIIDGKPVEVEKTIEKKELLFDEIEVVDEQGNVVKDEQGNILKHKVPRMVKKKRPIMKPVKNIPDCKALNSDQIIKALYGAVQYLIQKIESLENKGK